MFLKFEIEAVLIIKMKKLLYFASSALFLSQAKYSIELEKAGVNLIQNGDFSQPNIGSNWQIFSGSIGGWEGPFITVVKGSHYEDSSLQKSDQFLKLDYKNNSYTYQNVNLQGGIYKLSFDFMGQKNLDLKLGFLQVYWNKKIVGTIYLKNHEATRHELQVKGLKGVNELLFQQSNLNPHIKIQGILIDDVKLVRQSIEQQEQQEQQKPSEQVKFNYIKNGDFSAPQIKKFRVFDQKIYGWSGVKIQIGKAQAYNLNYDRYRNNQVMQLDVDKNQYIYQRIQYLPAGKYQLLLDCAAKLNKPLETSQFQIYWNKERINTYQPKNYELIKIQIQVNAKQGTNQLGFQGTGTSDFVGITIDNVRLYKKKQQIAVVLENNIPNKISHQASLGKDNSGNQARIRLQQPIQDRMQWNLQRKIIGDDLFNPSQIIQTQKINNLMRNLNNPVQHLRPRFLQNY